MILARPNAQWRWRAIQYLSGARRESGARRRQRLIDAAYALEMLGKPSAAALVRGAVTA